VRYWEQKVSFHTPASRTYSVQIQVAKRRAIVSLGTANKAQAAWEARKLYLDLRANGWEQTMCRRRNPQYRSPEAHVDLRFWEFWRHGLPEPPPASVVPSAMGAGLPSASGVYFLWSGGQVRYVGQSIRISGRVRLGHSALHLGDLISWLEFPAENLKFAEAFYIGILKPERNFAMSRQAAKNL
jgi:hypothetical protein